MYFVFATAYLLVALYLFALMLRIVYDVVSSFARYWRPKGINLVLAYTVHAITEPPLRFLRRKIPPLNMGGIGIDVAFLVVVFGLFILRILIVAGMRMTV